MAPRPTAHTLFLVVSASHAIKGEKALTKAGISCQLIPVPRAISSQCGVCLRVPWAERERAEQVLVEAGVHLTGSYDLSGEQPGRARDHADSHKKTRRRRKNADEPRFL